MTSTRMINLDDLIQAASRGDPGAQERLTDTQQLALFRRVAAGCRQPSKHTLVQQLNRPLREWPGLSILRRVDFDPATGAVDYTAGQDMLTEIPRLRRALLTF